MTSTRSLRTQTTGNTLRLFERYRQLWLGSLSILQVGCLFPYEQKAEIEIRLIFAHIARNFMGAGDVTPMPIMSSQAAKRAHSPLNTVLGFKINGSSVGDCLLDEQEKRNNGNRFNGKRPAASNTLLAFPRHSAPKVAKSC